MSRRIDLIEKAVVADTCSVWNLLSSSTLHRACVVARFDFILTDFVLYECLHKPRKEQRSADATLQERLKDARMRQQFKNYSLALEDLQEVAILEQRRRLSKGELASIAFAKRVGLAFQTDDMGARTLAATTLASERVQTTPHVVGWLFYEGRLADADLAEILREHQSFERPLRKFFQEMYEEAMRCRLLSRSAPAGVGPSDG